ncbi:MAG: carboxypeptidase-like regulatory domain-containing protein [Kofleriaceae bacterium]
MIRGHHGTAIAGAIIGALLVAVAAPTGIVHAQPAEAIGQPLPNSKLEIGTISVRVIDGSVTAPVSGADVTLTVNGAPRTARTDASGRATFAGIPPGSNVQATIKDASDNPLSSTTFPVPSQGGVSVMLSRKPFKGSGPMTGGPAMGGMPEPRAMSGIPRPDRNDPPGTITVRVTYNELIADPAAGIQDPAPPVGAPVALVGYTTDDKVTFKSGAVDERGIVQFTGLDRTSSTAYYALSQLSRGTATDRLIAAPVQLDGESGVRMILSGDKRSSSAPAINDYEKLLPSDGVPVPAGQVRVLVAGARVGTPVSLIDAATAKPIASLPTPAAAPDPSKAKADVEFQNSDQLPKGTLGVRAIGGAGSANNPLSGIEIKLLSPADQRLIEGAISATNADGMARVMTTVTDEVMAVVSMNGKQLATRSMRLADAGGLMVVTINWPPARPEVVFDVPYAPGQVLYAQTSDNRGTFRSLPFQTVPEAGTASAVFAVERSVLRFRLSGFPEDEFFAIQGIWEISNQSWAPYRASPDGYSIPLPPRHLGGVLAEEAKDRVTIEEGQGFRIAKPIPPLGYQFLGKFSLPVDHGTVSLRMDLPYGTRNSELRFPKSAEMSIKVPDDVKILEGQTQGGEPIYVVPVKAEPGTSISLSIAGLPSEPAWRGYLRIALGVLVICVLLGGVVFAVRRKQTVAEVIAERKAKLLDELVELEYAGKGGKRKEQLIAELEKIWVS